ncbi:MAG: dicarboxylate/amino acid:cation symporter [Parachlamydiales bacterium]|nr:dicarboxylate/amino acid:cation symporter [Parachlamydiales bacterium]
MPFFLIGLIIVFGIFHTKIPLHYQELFYGISILLKSAIIFVMPFLIFGLLLKTTLQFSKQASVVILGILVLICLSNFISTMLSFGIGNIAYHFDLSLQIPTNTQELQPVTFFSFPQWITNTQALIAGFLTGIILARRKNTFVARLTHYIDKGIHFLLQGILYCIPLFISGFLLKMYHDEMMVHLIGCFGKIFLLIVLSLIAYISLLYLIVNRGNFLSFGKNVKNMFPAVITGFGSMSSAAAMPLSIIGTEKNARYPDLARSVIPITVNIHLIGDCFAIPILAFAILKSFGMPAPSIMAYMIFAVFFVIAKFTIAAVPGGGILVMLPILEAYLGFNATMLSLITTLYILFDPLITSANILGNGGFALIASNLFGKKVFSEQTEKTQ